MPDRDMQGRAPAWCFGMLHTGSRPLSPDERAMLVRARDGVRRRLVRIAFAYVALWLPVFPVMLVLRQHESVVAVLLMYLLVASIVPGLPIVAIALLPSVRRWHEASNDLSVGTAECFVDPAPARAPGSPSPVPLVLASTSQRVLSGPAGTVGERLPIRIVPSTKARDWWIRVTSTDDSILERRRMHESERQEIREAIREAYVADRATLVSLLLLAVMLAALAWLLDPAEFRTSRLLPIGVAVLNTIGPLQTLRKKARAVHRALQLVRDLRTGMVLRFAPTDEERPATEFLPVSRLVWCEGEVPAMWRGWATTAAPAGPHEEDEARESAA